jgi:hypothetical protein
MKKIIITAALAIAAFGANAQSSASQTGTLSVTVNDYITMVPSGSFGTLSATFNTPAEQVAGVSLGSGTVTIVASRAWKFDYSVSNFTGGTPGPGVAGTVPSSIVSVTSSNPSSGSVWVLGTTLASPTAQTLAAEAGGTTGSSFTLSGWLTPGLGNQMSGTYTASVLKLASLN